MLRMELNWSRFIQELSWINKWSWCIYYYYLFNQGILNRNYGNNNFYDYTTIFIKYCSGSGYQGYNDKPYTYNGKDFYFTGSEIVENIFEYAFN